MFEVQKVGPDRVDIQVGGRLNSDDMKVALDALIEASADVKHGKMLYRLVDFDFPTLGALGVELSRLPKLFGLIGKFDRCAVLTDTDWIQTASEIEGALIPGLKIKAFDLDEQDEAERWLTAN